MGKKAWIDNKIGTIAHMEITEDTIQVMLMDGTEHKYKRVY